LAEAMSSVGTGTWCVQYTLPERRITSVVPRSTQHGLVRALVVRSGDPLGYVEFPLPAGDLDADQLDREMLGQLGDGPDRSNARPEGPAPFASVIVCTRNRPAEIESCLTRLTQLDYPDFEIVIVDNAPRDDRTRAVVERFTPDPSGHYVVRYVVEPTPGLSHARNRGLAVAQSEFVAYTDDDVSVDEHWLREVVAAFVVDDSIGCVTGMVCTADLPTPLERYFDSRAQNWSARLERQTSSLARHELGPLFPYTPGKFGTGANFAFRHQALDGMGGFDVALGAGTPTGGGEDLDAFVRVLLDGYAIAYTPRAIVWHHHRASAAELRKQMFAWGVGLGSFVLAHLARRQTRRLVLRRIVAGFAQLARTVRTESDRPAEPTPELSVADDADAGVPRGLMAIELLGLVLSPYYYLKSRWRARPAHGAS
jgi:GT2 family glycosyltransferase